ncbi:MAG: hypothetical protein AAB602_00130 [Patescibacteria group bacterium]
MTKTGRIQVQSGRILATCCIIFLLSQFLILPTAYTAIEVPEIPDGLTQSAKNAWSAISDFMGEVWQDTVNITSSFIKKTWADTKTVIAAASILREWISSLTPAGLKRVIAAVEDLFYKLFKFIAEIVKNVLLIFLGPLGIRI